MATHALHSANCTPRTFQLPWPYLLIGLLPLLVLIGSSFLLNSDGWPSPSRVVVGLGADSHSEIAARMRVLAALLVLCASSVAAAVYAGRIFHFLDWVSLGATAFAVVLLAVAAVSVFKVGLTQQTQELVDQRVVCTALSRPDRITLWQGSTAEADGRRRSLEQLPANCAAPKFLLLRRLIWWQQLFLIFAIPGIVFGAIACLAEPPAPLAREDEDAEAWRERELARLEALRKDQIKRLNTILYLAAFLLVAGLVFLSAFLHWPAFAVREPDLPSFHANIESVVLFYGVSYSVLIASFYLPVAALLTDKCRMDPKPPQADGLEDPAGLMATSQLVRVAAAVFSPAIVSLLGEVMTIPG